MARPRWFAAALGLVALALVFGSFGTLAARKGIQVKPSIVNETPLPNAAVAVARWNKTGGIDGGQGLILGKVVPTTEFAAGFANLTKVAGKTIQKLGFSVRSDAYCGAGAPRFNLYTEENDGGNTPRFFGCNSVSPTAMETVATIIDAEGVEWQVKEATLAAAGAEGETITKIEIVHDEQGVNVLDDIMVNNKVIGKGPRKKR